MADSYRNRKNMNKTYYIKTLGSFSCARWQKTQFFYDAKLKHVPFQESALWGAFDAFDCGTHDGKITLDDSWHLQKRQLKHLAVFELGLWS